MSDDETRPRTLVTIGRTVARLNPSCPSCNADESPGLFVDPVCKMSTRDPGAFIPFVHEGVTYYFCNPSCLDKFKKEPELYLDRRGASQTSGRPRPPVETAGRYTCPMHPEVSIDHPGTCPICGMALEAAAPSLEETSDPEYQDMLRRFLASVPASAALMILAMGHMLPAASLKELFLHPASQWLQLALATPVVFWAGLPFLERAWVSVRTRSLNMFTLIALGVMVSYLYSTIAVLAPWLFPDLVQMGHQRTAIYFESASMIVTLVLLGQVLELKARRRTQDAVRMLLSLAPKNARIVHEDGREEDIPVDAVQPNDRLRVRPGEKIPADGIVLSGDGVIDESMITGESMPVDKGPGARVTAGTINQAGSFVMEAHRTGKDTLLSSIVKITLEAARSRAPVQRLADKVSAVFVPVVMGASLITFFLWMVSGHEARFALGIVSAVSVLVIACPCALGLATPMSIMVASGRGARMGILFRDASAIERLRQVDTLVVDKTGTLTEGRPSLEEIVTTADIDERTVLALASGVAEGSEHPLSKALVKEAAGRGIASAVCTDFATYPGRGVRGTAQGKSIILGNSRFMQDEGMDTSRLDAQARRISSRGSTVLFVAIDGKVSALLGFSDRIKESSFEAMAMIGKEKIRVVMLSGDSREAAENVARRLSIGEVMAGVLPDEKAGVVARLQAEGRVVAMAGDGVNDAPALARADVGIAMGSGTDIAMESAAVTLVKGDLRGIARAFFLSRATMRNIAQNLFFAFLYNALCIPVAAGALYPLFGIALSPMIAAAAMSFSSLSVVANSLRLNAARI